MSIIYATTEVAIVGNYPRYRMIAIETETQQRVDLCTHEHVTRDEAEDCPDARGARGLPPVPSSP